MLITAMDHPLAGRDTVTMEEAATHPFVATAPTHTVRQVVETILRQRGITVDVVVEAEGWSVVTRYVAAGAGISIVPDLCLTARERVWKTPIGSVLPRHTYGAATRRDGLLSLAARRFLRLMVAEDSRAPPAP